MGEMKLRRKKMGNSSAFRLSPVSWLSKFMQMGGVHSSPKPTTMEKKKKKKTSVPVPDSWDGGRFYCGEDDPYFRLSFGGQKSRDERGKFNEMVSDVRRTKMSGTNRGYFELDGEEVEEEEEMEPKRGSRNIEKDCRNLTAFQGQTRTKQKQKQGRVYSPRRTSMSRTECKIKPLEDLKKKKKKKKKKKSFQQVCSC